MSLKALHAELITCRSCKRLVSWREQVGKEKVARHRDSEYWAKPVPGFGDPKARIVIFGLAPGAHGSNRTGRPFTGDSSGEFLYRALHRAGLCNQPESKHKEDGLKLKGVYITASVRCAPPQNKPTPEEIRNCARWTERELPLLPSVRVYLAQGRIAHDALLAYYGLRKPAHGFGHGAEHPLPDGRVLIDSYHVSRQNTNTGKLTEAMFDLVMHRVKVLAGY